MAAGNGNDRPTIRSRTIIASVMITVIMLIVLGQAFGPAFGYDIRFPATAWPLFGAAVAFWFGLKLSDFTGDKDDREKP